MRRLAIIIVAFLFLVPLFAQQPSNSDAALRHIQPEIIRAHMRFLADDLLEGRGTGTRGDTFLRLMRAGTEQQFRFGDDFLAFGATTQDDVILNGDVVFVG